LSLLTYFTSQQLDNEMRGTDHILENDFFAQAFVKKEFHNYEAMLSDTKWFDYRFMTPLQATKAYVAAYGEIYRRIYRREIDRERSEHLRVLTWDSIVQGVEKGETKWKRVLTGCWRGRQFADGIGMPYEHYIENAMTFRMRRWQQRHMPQPEHLYHAVVLDKVSQRWEELMGTDTWTSDHPAFLVQNYDGLKVQDDYHEWLFAQSMRRSDPLYFLAHMIRQDMLPMEKVRARYPDEDDQQKIEQYLAHP